MLGDTDTAERGSSTAKAEADRQLTICNACRYCEGFCAVFPAVHRHRTFNIADVTQIANLCHNCRACHYACQYTAPHEFNVNLPKALADARLNSWQDCSWPAPVARLFQRSGVAMSIALVVGITLLFILARGLGSTGGSGFYAHLSHSIMITIFLPAFGLPLMAIAVALRRYWRLVHGEKITWQHLGCALQAAANLRNLAGGQGQGCNYESGDRYSNQRRWAHQLTVIGFLLCFASTASGTLMHYLFDLPAPYALLSVPKLLGLPGGVLLVLGCVWLVVLKSKADPHLGASGLRGGETAFVVLLGATGATGLLLYAATGSEWVGPLLAVHLGTVLTFFLTLPYSKMAHGFFRLAALTRDAQQTQR